MKSSTRNALILITGAAIAAVLMWGFVVSRSNDNSDDDSPVQAPPRAAQINGQTAMKFDEQAQRANGIVVTALKAARRGATTSAAATVLDLQPLLDVESKYLAAQTAIAQARAAATASEAEYKRLAGLNQNGENVSQKSVEAAQAAAESDAASLNSSRQNLAILHGSTQVHWSATITNWIENDSPPFKALIDRRDYLLQVTTTNPGKWSAPAEAIIELPNGAHVAARRITELPQVDPHLQAPSYLYSVPAHSGIVPGLNLPVSLPAGPMKIGTVIPQSAVVWSQGQAWVYVGTAQGQFTRVPISTDNPTPGGWFVSGAPAAGTRVVTGGAETLFSEEFRSKIQSDED